MPCSGLKSAARVTSFASCSRSMAGTPSRDRPVWLVTRPTRLPRSAANPAARIASSPVTTAFGRTAGACGALPWSWPVKYREARERSGTDSIADAATVATRARSGVTSPLPSGCSRLDRKITNIRVAGSIHSDVPVNPVWPNDPSGSSSPRFDENAESTSQPSAREPRSSAVAAGVVSFATVSGASTSFPRNVPPESSMRQKFARSAAVPNRPACPATPPMRRAVGSCTVPRSIFAPGPSHGQPISVHASVGAMRGRSDSGGLNIVSFMPRGPKICSLANWSSGTPLIRRTMSPSRKKLMSL